MPVSPHSPNQRGQTTRLQAQTPREFPEQPDFFPQLTDQLVQHREPFDLFGDPGVSFTELIFFHGEHIPRQCGHFRRSSRTRI